MPTERHDPHCYKGVTFDPHRLPPRLPHGHAGNRYRNRIARTTDMDKAARLWREWIDLVEATPEHLPKG